MSTIFCLWVSCTCVRVYVDKVYVCVSGDELWC